MPTVWKFAIGRVSVELEIIQDCGYQYDGDDENGEIQAALDRGEFVAFDSIVRVYIDNLEMGVNSLSGSVYEFGRESEFWTAHRDPDAMNRNCEAMRCARGSNVVICHYFPGMVREAISAARECFEELQKLERIEA